MPTRVAVARRDWMLSSPGRPSSLQRSGPEGCCASAWVAQGKRIDPCTALSGALVEGVGQRQLLAVVEGMLELAVSGAVLGRRLPAAPGG